MTPTNPSRLEINAWWLIFYLVFISTGIFECLPNAPYKFRRRYTAIETGYKHNKNIRSVKNSLTKNTVSEDLNYSILDADVNPYKHRHKRYIVPLQPYDGVPEINQPFLSPLPYFNQYRRYGENAERRPNFAPYLNGFSLFEGHRGLSPNESYSRYQNRNPQSKIPYEVNHKIELNFGRMKRDYPELFHDVKSLVYYLKNAPKPDESVLKMNQPLYFKRVVKRDWRNYGFDGNADKYRKSTLKGSSNLGASQKLRHYPHLKSSSMGRTPYNQNLKRYIPQHDKRKMTPLLENPYLYHRRSLTPRIERGENEPFMEDSWYDFRKFKRTSNKDDLMDKNASNKFYKKLIFKRVTTARNNLIDVLPEKDSVNTDFESRNKPERSTTYMDGITLRDLTGFNHRISENDIKMYHGEPDSFKNTTMDDTTSESEMFNREQVYKIDSEKNETVPREGPREIFDVERESDYWKTKNSPISYWYENKRTSGENTREKNNSENIPFQNSYKYSEMNFISTEKNYAFTGTEKETNGKDFPRNSTAARQNQIVPKSSDSDDVSMLRNNLTKQNDTVIPYKRSNKDDFISVQIIGDFLKSDALERRKKESRTKHSEAGLKNTKNQRSKRQEALFIVLALFGVTTVILLIACIAFITKRRKKDRKAKEKKSRDEMRHGYADVVKTASVSRSSVNGSDLAGKEKIDQDILKDKYASCDALHSELRKQEKRVQESTSATHEGAFYDDSNTESEENIESASVDNVRQTRSLPIAVSKSYEIKRPHNNRNQQLEPLPEGVIIDKMHFNEEDFEGVESSESYEDEIKADSEYKIPRKKSEPFEGQTSLNPASYMSLNIEESIPAIKDLSANYDDRYNMEYSHDDYTRRDAHPKQKRKNNAFVDSLVNENVHQRQFSTYEDKEAESYLEKFVKYKVEKLQKTEQTRQRTIHKHPIVKSVNIDNSKLKSSTSSVLYPSIPKHRDEGNDDRFETEEHNASESEHLEKPGKVVERDIGSPWERILIVKPSHGQNNVIHISDRNNNSILGEPEENVEAKTSADLSERYVSCARVLEKSDLTEEKKKANFTNRNHPWKHVIRNMRSFSGSKINNTTIINDFRA